MLTYALIIDTSRDVIRLVWGRDVAEGGWSKTRCTMRLVSPYTLCAFVIIWTLFFLFIARYFLFSAHQVSCQLATLQYNAQDANTFKQWQI